MFKRFDASTDCSTSTQVKASVQRSIKSSILASHPAISEDDLSQLIPKKPPLVQYKAGQHLMLYCLENAEKTQVPIFFQARDGPILPALRLVHEYPELGFTSVTVDKGAISFILGGANIMCPGLTNPGASMPPGLTKGSGVVIMAEGKEHAIAVGVMKMSSTDILTKNKGQGIEVSHFLGDGLFQTQEIL